MDAKKNVPKLDNNVANTLSKHFECRREKRVRTLEGKTNSHKSTNDCSPSVGRDDKFPSS